MLAAVASSSAAALRTSLGAVKRSGLVSQTGSPPWQPLSVPPRPDAGRRLRGDDQGGSPRAARSGRHSAGTKVSGAARNRAGIDRLSSGARGLRPTTALPYWQSAGTEIGGRAAGHVEAIAHYNAALALLNLLPPGLERLQKELECLLPLATSLASSLGYAADEVRDVLTRAREICGLMGGRLAAVFRLLHGLSKFWTVRGDQGARRGVHPNLRDHRGADGQSALYRRKRRDARLCAQHHRPVRATNSPPLVARGPRVYDENESACQQNWSERPTLRAPRSASRLMRFTRWAISPAPSGFIARRSTGRGRSTGRSISPTRSPSPRPIRSRARTSSKRGKRPRKPSRSARPMDSASG